MSSHNVQRLSSIRKSCFTDSCYDIMDFFLQNPRLYFTPYTASLSMNRSHPTIKDCMRLLHRNSYLSKLSHDGSVYHMTLENMKFWRVGFKNYMESLSEKKGMILK